MKDLVLAILVGSIVTFIFDFFIFLGMKLHYIDLHNIEVYFNTFFADNQNFFLYFFFTLFYGALIIYVKNVKLILITLLFSALCSFSTLLYPIGSTLAHALFMQENVSLKYKKRLYNGDIYYDGRDKITFYYYKLEKMIQLEKKDITQ